LHVTTELKEAEAEPASTRAGARQLGEWTALDHERALHPPDHEIIPSTSGLRLLILERIASGPPHHDLFSACAILGRLIAERGGSPTLACTTMDSAREAAAPGDPSPAWLIPARAALAEGYASAQRDLAKREAAAAWEYPRCTVELGGGTVAILAGFPADDGEAIASWASRVAQRVAMSGARRAIVAGSDAGRLALVEALETAGVAIETPERPERPGIGRDKPWLPWRRGRPR
jgi:hypothetical protein